MKKANLSYTKNHLSQIVRMVKEGSSVTLVDRQRPVAVLRPIEWPETDDAAHLAKLVNQGIAAVPRRRLEPNKLSRMPWPDWRPGRPLAALVDEDRGDLQ